MTDDLPHCLDDSKLVEMLTSLVESAEQADSDFCGEQREWHLPRLHRALVLALELFPRASFRAFEKAKTPYGDSL